MNEPTLEEQFGPQSNDGLPVQHAAVPPVRVEAVVRCFDCRFADDQWAGEPCEPDDKRFVCRRFPPSMLVSGYNANDVSEGSLNFIQPTVVGCNWCGEFKPRTPNKAFDEVNRVVGRTERDCSNCRYRFPYSFACIRCKANSHWLEREECSEQGERSGPPNLTDSRPEPAAGSGTADSRVGHSEDTMR